jgi:MYXO-CTERM domain-containing protein
MSFRSRRLARFGIAALLGSLATFASSQANADTAPASCDAASLTCTVGRASSLSVKIDKGLGTEIDSGWMDKGNIKIRTKFSIEPIKGEPFLALDMPAGSLVEASWPEKGQITLRAAAPQGGEGTMNVRYTLAPTLSANIYGITVNYDANQLINMLPGARFNYDQSAQAKVTGWGFGGAEAMAAAPPALDKSTIFALPFEQLGVDPGIVEGTLSIQAATRPTFKYTTKELRLDSGSVTSADGTTKIPAVDADFLDLNATVVGELTMTGALDVRPVVKIDSVSGYPTFGLVKFSFSAVKKEYSGTPQQVSFQNTTIHIPLPNIKVPSKPFSIGKAGAGGSVEKTVAIDSTGELEGMIEVSSSDPQFIVPSGKIKVGSKSKYDLKVMFKPSSDAPASATITVRSNDPDSPEQTFKVAANGARVGDEGEEEEDGNGRGSANAPQENDGCAVSTTSSSSKPGFFALGLGLAVVAFVRRRRS